MLPGVFANISIRGIRTGAYGPTTESPNAIHIDGVYLPRFTGLDGYFFDIQRIEVLAGPQGTLYGRNSAGGAINIITQKPIDRFAAHASIEYGNYNTLITNDSINVPITDSLAVRGAYYHAGHDGYTNVGLNDEDINGGRLSALWKPTTADTLLFTADYEHLGGRGGAPALITQVYKSPTILVNGPCHQYLCTVPAGTPGGALVPILPASGPSDYYSVFGNESLYHQDTKNEGVMAQEDHNFGWATLTTQVSYRDTSTNNTLGSTSYSEDPRLQTTFPAVLQTDTSGALPQHSEWNSEEMRLASPSGQTLTYTIGLYRFQERSSHNDNLTFLTLFPNTSAATIGTFIHTTDHVLPSVTSAGHNINTDIANVLGTDVTYAAFGQATYTPAFLPALHVTGGLRLNYEDKHGIGFEVLNGALNPSSVFDQRATFRAITYKINVAYDITPANLIYFDNSTGFKSGGFGYGQNPEYNPERITSYEIGSKNRFFDNRVQANLSAWHYDYKDYVATTFLFYFDTRLGHPAAIIDTTNAPSSTVDGQTLTLTAYATPDDVLTFNGTHLRTEFVSFNTAPLQAFTLAHGIQPGATAADFNYSGTPIFGEPDISLAAGYDHTFHALHGTLDAEADLNYTGSYLYAQAAKIDQNNYKTSTPAATVDLSVRYRPDVGNWSLTAYARNVGNQNVVTGSAYVSNAPYLPTSDPRVTYAYRTTTYGPPRTFGVIATADF